MYKEIRLVKLNDNWDKIYVFFNHIFYYDIMKLAPNKILKNHLPQISKIAFKEDNLSMLLVIKKDTFKLIYDYIEELSNKIYEVEKLSIEDLKIASKIKTTDQKVINKIKEVRKIFNELIKNNDSINKENKIINLHDIKNKK
ncbi:MAG: hypothetical protein ACOCP8_01525 [archaeon]